MRKQIPATFFLAILFYNIPSSHKQHETTKNLFDDLISMEANTGGVVTMSINQSGNVAIDPFSEQQVYSYLPSPADSTPANCMWDLKDSIFAEVDSIGPISYAKPGTRPIPNYYDVSFANDKLSFSEGYNEADKKTCSNKDTCITDESESLIYMAYFPKGHNYSAKKLPALIIAHAGGFSDCSTLKYLSPMCILFAKRGFVVFNPEYRRGRVKDDGGFTSVQQMAANYRAAQDFRGVIRSIVKKESDSGAYLAFRIDTTNIFVGGQSAGATAAINAIYYPTQAMVNAVFPTPVGKPTIEDVLGPIEADFYYGSPSVSYLQKVKAVFNMWGGVPIPLAYENNQSDFFYSTNPIRNKPMIAFMGFQDQIFSYLPKFQKVFFSPNYHSKYNTDTFCLVDTPYTLEAIDTTKDLIMGSSINLYYILKDLGRSVEILIDCQMKHGLDTNGVYFQSEFGTGLTTQEAVNLYMVQRICCFIQLEMNGLLAKRKGTDKFVECENFRVQCDTLAHNNSCTMSQNCF